MTSLSRVRVALTAFDGAPGVATFYFLDMNTALASLSQFWTSVAPFMPSGLKIDVASSGDVIEDTSGVITGAWGGDYQETITASGIGDYAAPAGAVVQWQTTTIMDGKRLRGRTFLVPLCGQQLGPRGALLATCATQLTDIAQLLTTQQSESLVVWHRKYKGRTATDKLPARPAHDGGHGLVTGALCTAKVAVLRSRRD